MFIINYWDIIPSLSKFIYIYMGNGQYLVYSSKSSIFEECIIGFFRFWEDSKCYCFFEECIILFQAPA